MASIAFAHKSTTWVKLAGRTGLCSVLPRWRTHHSKGWSLGGLWAGSSAPCGLGSVTARWLGPQTKCPERESWAEVIPPS